MSRPPGQEIVPVSGSTSTRANSAGSLSGSKTPRHSRSAKSTSPTVPSANVSRRRYSPTTSTPVMSTSLSTPTCYGSGSIGSSASFASSSVPVSELAVEPDRGGLTRLAGMEMRPSVHAFVPVHPDRDPVEGARGGGDRLGDRPRQQRPRPSLLPGRPKRRGDQRR